MVTKRDTAKSPVGGTAVATKASLVTGAGALASVLAAPTTALACAVCFGGENSEWPAAFNLGIATLLGMPFAIVGFGGFTIYRSIKRQEQARAAQEN